MEGEKLYQLINKYYDSLSSSEKRLFNLYNATLKDIKKQLIEHSNKMAANSNLNDWYRGDRLAKLEKDIEIIIKNMFSDVADEVEKTAIEKGIAFDKEFAKMLIEAYPEAGNFTGLNNAVIKEIVKDNWLGITFYDRLDHKAINMLYDYRNIIRTGIVQGKSIANIIEDIGIATGKYYKQTETMVRSEVLHTLNASVVNQYKELGVSSVEHFTAEDERVCKTCGKAHGKTYLLGKEPNLPLHPSCRCTYIVSAGSIEKAKKDLGIK